jgi:hypothetical protein
MFIMSIRQWHFQIDALALDNHRSVPNLRVNSRDVFAQHADNMSWMPEKKNSDAMIVMVPRGAILWMDKPPTHVAATEKGRMVFPFQMLGCRRALPT